MSVEVQVTLEAFDKHTANGFVFTMLIHGSTKTTEDHNVDVRTGS